ncbi:MAG: FAD-dependent oxidoreductase [Bacteroidota bacterium]
MTRKEFLRMCGLLGIGMPLQGLVSSCGKDPIIPIDPTSSSEQVIIIGAGPAGMTAAYLLNQQGIEAPILEANSTYGGRIRRNLDFADFPIPLGAEWLHVERGIFDEIVNDSSVNVDIATTPYDLENDVALYEGNEVSVEDIGFTVDQKFISSSWLDFFDEYVVPTISGQFNFNQVVQAIDYSGDQVVIKTADQEYTAQRVIITVPVKILQNGAITFTPALPDSKQKAIDKVTVWDGCKAFIEFSEKFYPTMVGFDISPESDGQKLYYDAAYGQNTNQHILGLFAVGTGTLPYVELSDADRIDYMLTELDDLFDGQATPNYKKHLFQNWNEEPFANGAYVYDYENWLRLRQLGESVDGKLFFAGDAYTDGFDWSSVHAAARSAISAVSELVG